jgi:alpha-amylase
MKYWITNHNIDGFRCDVAMEVPKDFWETASAELFAVKPIFMLMEAEQKDLMEKAFDMQYGWKAHHIFNKIYKGENTVDDFDAYMIETQTAQLDDIYMNFTSNHDENSWNGTEYERINDAVETFAALTFMMPGMPLIYNGQEYDLNKRLKFFEKDEIPHVEGKMMAIYRKLGALKTNNKALHGGKKAAPYKRIATSENKKVLAFERGSGTAKLVYLANLSKEEITVKVNLKGTYKSYMSGEMMSFDSSKDVTLKPWQYYILE